MTLEINISFSTHYNLPSVSPDLYNALLDCPPPKKLTYKILKKL